jgi:hypothetical protein
MKGKPEKYDIKLSELNQATSRQMCILEVYNGSAEYVNTSFSVVINCQGHIRTRGTQCTWTNGFHAQKCFIIFGNL